MLVQIITENGQKKIKPLTADAGAGNPVGTIIVVCSNQIPSNYLPLGTQYDTSLYPVLYALLGTDTTPTASALGLPTLTSGQYAIKATSGLSENAQDNVVAQLNEERSYSTSEVNTGKKWIDGKKIYSKTVYIASTSSGVLDISSMNIDTPIAVVNAVAYKYNDVADKQALPLLSGQIRGGIAFQHASLTVTRGDASYNYGDIYITLEYTKTTD